MRADEARILLGFPPNFCPTPSQVTSMCIRSSYLLIHLCMVAIWICSLFILLISILGLSLFWFNFTNLNFKVKDLARALNPAKCISWLNSISSMVAGKSCFYSPLTPRFNVFCNCSELMKSFMNFSFHFFIVVVNWKYVVLGLSETSRNYICTCRSGGNLAITVCKISVW